VGYIAAGRGVFFNFEREQMNDLFNRNPPEAEWARQAVETATMILAELYIGSERKAVWELVLQLQSDVRGEVKHVDQQTGELIGKTVSYAALMECKDPNGLAERESSYRRGYVHGYCHACDDVQDSRSISEMNKHVDTLMEWRADDCFKFVVPPGIKEKNR
jgi:hypothetical protein